MKEVGPNFSIQTETILSTKKSINNIYPVFKKIFEITFNKGIFGSTEKKIASKTEIT